MDELFDWVVKSPALAAIVTTIVAIVVIGSFRWFPHSESGTVKVLLALIFTYGSLLLAVLVTCLSCLFLTWIYHRVKNRREV